MIKSLILILNLIVGGSVLADISKDTPRDTLKNLEGCFEVTYEFVEDGAKDKKYSPIIEYIRPKTENGKLIFEHIGQYPKRDVNGNHLVDEHGDKTYFVQYHWKEEWQKVGDSKWSQAVYGPYGDFRYSCEAKWTLNQFHCHTEKAGKPRRDRKRAYDHMVRINNIHINNKRWVHGQRNKKFLADGSLFSIEMGWNTYKKVDLKICQPSIDANPGPLK